MLNWTVALSTKVRPYLYNNGDGKWIHCALLACLRNRDRPPSKQLPEIRVSSTSPGLAFLSGNSCGLQALGEEAFSFKFEDSELVEGLIRGQVDQSTLTIYRAVSRITSIT